MAIENSEDLESDDLSKLGNNQPVDDDQNENTANTEPVSRTHNRLQEGAGNKENGR